MRRVLLRHFQSRLGPGTFVLGRHGVYVEFRASQMPYWLRGWRDSV
jgi:hypothetical protein